MSCQASGKYTQSALCKLFTKIKLNGVNGTYRATEIEVGGVYKVRCEFHSELLVFPSARIHRVVLTFMSFGHKLSGVLLKVIFLSVVKQRQLSCRYDMKSDSRRECSAHWLNDGLCVHLCDSI
jgi:hypothetical protein